ncbi:uncharacterized protein Bfra_003899 [Botrytis fragariae]|uniref:Uncharacterized protein n=1 Tax=Botrytis fragariae TaxID=1964551 RepID=A0A8H6EKP8_9HELO|nr:uncharacterized protein Bfra_003899 [Botrytis fragariae]KAF5875445.1 hypothetical protein Bfra_003899 [Botrytis fragariae]
MYSSLFLIETSLTVEIFDLHPLANNSKARSFGPTCYSMDKAEILQMVVVISMTFQEGKNKCRRLHIHYIVSTSPTPACQQYSPSYALASCDAISPQSRTTVSEYLFKRSAVPWA